METRSRTNKRIYPRKFDHDEAARLRAEDPKTWTYKALAERFGVSMERVRQVLDPVARARVQAHSNDWARRTRRACLGGCGRLVWSHMKARTGYCLHCLVDLEAAARDAVREGELRCTKCGEWKPDEDFPGARMGGGRKRGRTRRYKSTFCRACSTAARRDHRHRHPRAQHAYDRVRAPIRTERNSSMSLYIVLKEVQAFDEDGSPFQGRTFVEIGEVEAVNADMAIEKLATDSDFNYVAPLATRFEVVTVAPQTSLRVSR